MSKIKEIVILSGKGGTGKTSIAGSFVVFSQNKVVVDCDVDAADLHLILQPDIREKNEFWSGQVAMIESQYCNQCGQCYELCRFNAIKDYTIDSVSCEGCGLCAHVCSSNAIKMITRLAGEWFVSDTQYGEFVHARLGIAQENSGKLVALIRRVARECAEKNMADIIISDGPPGTGCPVISSISGVNLAVLVTEPSLSAIHDLKRIIGVCQHFTVPVAVCVNKYDINKRNSRQIEKYCMNNDIPVIGKIPFDHAFTDAIVQKKPVVLMTDSVITEQLKDMWERILSML